MLLSTGRKFKRSATTNSASDFSLFFPVKSANLLRVSLTFKPQHDSVNLCHGTNRFFFLAIFSTVVKQMTPIANSKPSELQPCATAAPLTGVLIWKPPSKYVAPQKTR